jgi:hypothetical protein
MGETANEQISTTLPAKGQQNTQRAVDAQQPRNQAPERLSAHRHWRVPQTLESGNQKGCEIFSALDGAVCVRIRDLFQDKNDRNIKKQ